MNAIREYLLSNQDIKYHDFTLPLLPNIDEIYRVRYAVKCLMNYYLSDDHKAYLKP